MNSCAIGRVKRLNGHEKPMKTVKARNHENHENENTKTRKSRNTKYILTAIDFLHFLAMILDPGFLLNGFFPHRQPFADSWLVTWGSGPPS